MVKRRDTADAAHSAGEREMRDQEVLRANRELAAYFKGRRTEREARAALKIIKAFVRHRERQDAKSRPALPGARATPKPLRAVKRRSATRSRSHRESPPFPFEASATQKASGEGPQE